MFRIFLAALAATVAAPYLFSFMHFLVGILGRDIVELESIADLPKFLLPATFGLLMFGLPTLAAAGFIGWILSATNRRSRWHSAVCGAALGIAIIALVFSEPSEHYETLPVAALSGALCGWIYWRIAFREPARSPEIER